MFLGSGASREACKGRVRTHSSLSLTEIARIRRTMASVVSWPSLLLRSCVVGVSAYVGKLSLSHTHPNNIRSFIQHGSTPFPVVRCRRQGQQDIFDLGERSHFQGKQPKARNSFYFIQHRSPSESSLTDYVEKLVE